MVFTYDYHNSLLSSNGLCRFSHHLEPSEKQKMAGGNSLYNHSHAFSSKIVQAEIEVKLCP